LRSTDLLSQSATAITIMKAWGKCVAAD